MLRCFVSLFLIVGVFLVSGCGQRVCVAGIGECAIQKPAGSGLQNQIGADQQFDVTANKYEVFEGDVVELKVANSNKDWEIHVIDGPSVTNDKKTDDFTFSFTASSNISGTSQVTRLRGTDRVRFKSESETPKAMDDISIQIKKKIN